MIVLSVQIRIFVLCIVSGWIYGIIYSFLQLVFINRRITFFRILIEILFQLIFHTTLFYLLFNLNYGVVRIYYVLLFILGICSYYLFYYPIVLPLYSKVIHYVKVPIKRFFLVFSQYISIIRMLLKKIKRRLHNDTGNQKKGSKEKT